ncbi:MAG: 30S ribosomal protein S18 [bacterium]
MAYGFGNGEGRGFGRDRDKDKDKKGKDRDGKGFKKKGRMLSRPRVCRFCADRKLTIDYKDVKLLTSFVTERGKIVPRRISGNCAGHQRCVTEAIKRGRILALVPFTATQTQMA